MKRSLNLGLIVALGALTTLGCSSDGSSSSNNGGSTASGGTSSGGSGTGGTNGGGTSSGGTAGTATGGSAGQSSTGGGAGASACDYGTVTGVGGASGATTAIVLVDDVVMKDAANATVVTDWQFADDTSVVDTTTDTGDKWTRTQWAPLNDNAGASNHYLACDGSPDNGSLENVVPFGSEADAANRYYEVHVPFAGADYHDHHVTAKVKLVAGTGSCAPRAQLFTILAQDPYTAEAGPLLDLVEGQWVDVTLDVPTTFSVIDQIGVRLTWQGC